MAKKQTTADDRSLIEKNWLRYQYGKNRGHETYIETARFLEGMYLGGGEQWSDEDKQALKEAGKPFFEFNQILPKINAALGYQISNRMDISFKPRGGATDQALATIMSKVAMQVADNTHLQWKETQVFADGLIQQRGFFDIRMSYDDNMMGEIRVETLDPMDVIPDPDAKDYDPDTWQDVIITRWLTLDEIEGLYGTEKRSEVEGQNNSDADFGDELEDEERNKFGMESVGGEYGTEVQGDGTRRYRVIDRQAWRIENSDVLITLEGDIRPINDLSPLRVQAIEAQGAIKTKRRIRRVRWTVTTCNTVLFDDWSPFNHFTVVPFFPLFRRGKTRGLVDNAVGPQQMVNKSLSQFVHIVNTTSNSGWITWANTLHNMDEQDIEDRGSETGLHIQVKKDTPTDKMPRKIQPNQIPQGMDRIIERGSHMLENATSINDAMVGNQGREVSGIAIQSRQHAAQQQLSVPLDNLARTRNMLAGRMLDMIQNYYDNPRIMRITETDAQGKEITEELQLNQPMDDGGILNNLTLGEYDIVITEVPTQITFENSQFMQLMEMIDKGAPIPWSFVLRHSNLAKKQDIIEALEQQQQNQTDPLTEAKVKLTEAQAMKAAREAVNKAVESQYSAIQTAGVIEQTPQTSPLADSLLRSAGYEDQDAAPIVPEYQQGAEYAPVAPDVPTNTNPLTPANPAVGMNAGIETPELVTEN